MLNRIGPRYPDISRYIYIEERAAFDQFGRPERIAEGERPPRTFSRPQKGEHLRGGCPNITSSESWKHISAG